MKTMFLPDEYMFFSDEDVCHFCLDTLDVNNTYPTKIKIILSKNNYVSSCDCNIIVHESCFKIPEKKWLNCILCHAEIKKTTQFISMHNIQYVKNCMAACVFSWCLFVCYFTNKIVKYLNKSMK
jgi:hypothetical protein